MNTMDKLSKVLVVLNKTGNKIAAIKTCREETGLNLAESKVLVEALCGNEELGYQLSDDYRRLAAKMVLNWLRDEINEYHRNKTSENRAHEAEVASLRQMVSDRGSEITLLRSDLEIAYKDRNAVIEEVQNLRGQLALKDREIEKLDEDAECHQASLDLWRKVSIKYEAMFGSFCDKDENPVMGVLNHMTTYFRHVRREYGTRFFNTVLKTAILASKD